MAALQRGSAGGAMIVAWSLLVVLLAGLWWWTVRDVAVYAEFREVTETKRRQTIFLRWAGQSFVALTGAGLVALALLGRLPTLWHMPPEFSGLVASADTLTAGAGVSSDDLLGVAVGFFLAVVILLIVQARRSKGAVPPAGDFEALIPRNGAEMWAVVPLCVNAGFSEELFFRLALPLVIATATGSAWVGVAAGCVIFGAIHAYQGIKGVVATTLLGAVFWWVYLGFGSLLWPMIAHAMLDVMGLIVRPRIVGSMRTTS